MQRAHRGDTLNRNLYTYVALTVEQRIVCMIHIIARWQKDPDLWQNVFCSLKAVHIEAFNTHCRAIAQHIERKAPCYI